MNAPLYTIDILRLAASNPEPRRLARVDGSAEERSATCGSRIRVEVALDAAGRVEAVSHLVQACAFGQASAALMAAGAIGRDRHEVQAALEGLQRWLMDAKDDPGSWPGLSALAPGRARQSRHQAILLPFRALSRAMAAAR